MRLRDELTGLLSRTGLWEEVPVRHGPLDGGLLLADVDAFMWLNHALGHHAGDAYLVQLARMLERECGGGLLARYSGAEFVALLPKFSQTVAFAEVLRSRAEEEFEGVRRRVRDAAGSTLIAKAGLLTLSVGVVELAKQGDLERGLRVADAAVQEAKKSGGNRVRIH